MKKLTIGLLTSSVMLGSSAFGQLVQAPWPTSGGAEQNLYQILGFNNNAALNAAIVNQSGGSFTPFELTAQAASQYSSLLLEEAGNAPNNTFGVYVVGDTGSSFAANSIQLLNGANGPNLNPADAVQLSISTALNTVTVTVGNQTISGSAIGFYLNTGAGGNGIYYSALSDELNANGNNMQHVAAFNIGDTVYGQAPYPTVGQSGFVMAWEDLPASSSDFDYNDMVVSLTALPVPEPSTVVAGAMLLLPFGLSTVRLARGWRMRRA